MESLEFYHVVQAESAQMPGTEASDWAGKGPICGIAFRETAP